MLYEDEDGIYNEIPMRDVWDIPYLNSQVKKEPGIPRKKPLRPLQRIIKASSNAGDMVLDPFCGCATACIAAQIEERQWAGIDISSKATELVQQRMGDELNLFFQGSIRTDIPAPTLQLPRESKVALRPAGRLLRRLFHTLRDPQSGS